MEVDTLRVKQDRKATVILFVSMIIGIVLFLIISLLINQLQGAFINDKSVENGLEIAAVLIAVVALFAGNRLYNQRIEKLRGTTGGIDKRLIEYRAALVLFSAITEFAALFSIVSFLLTGNYLFVAIVIVMLSFMLWRRPSKSNMMDAMGLTANEQIGLE
jgi:uncharacterized protein with PQ loop repeat